MQGDEQIKRDALDERIDAALRQYLEAPKFSDAHVAMARVRALAEERPRRRVWAWAVPACAAALIALVALVWMGSNGAGPRIAFAPKAPGVASVASASGLTPSGARAPHVPASLSARLKSCPDTSLRGCAKPTRRIIFAQRKLPKRDVFPTPEPLSDQERALLTLATQAPPDVTKQVLEAQKHLGDPIQIAAIRIRPLDEDEQKTEPTRKDLR